jgi:hypothetical protein
MSGSGQGFSIYVYVRLTEEETAEHSKAMAVGLESKIVLDVILKERARR